MYEQNFLPDTTRYEFNEVDSTFVDSLIRSGSYDYINQNIRGEGLWASIRDFIFGWLREQGIHLGNWIENLLIILCLLALLIGVIYFISKYRSKSRSHLKGQISPPLYESEKEWNSAFVARQLEESKQDQNWKEAVRWAYHLGLIWLNDKDIIQRSEYKTAYDYQKEISNPKIQALFIQLKNLHERAWYDEVEISEQELHQGEDSIRSIKQILNEAD